MDQGQIYTIVQQVTKKLTPSAVSILSLEDDVLTVRVVSESFDSLPMVKRFRLLADLFETDAQKLLESYTLVFEAWTKAEIKDLEAGEDGSSGAVRSSGNSRAAKDIDL